MLILQASPLFQRTVRTVILNNRNVRSKIQLALRRLRKNPFDPYLDTKKVYTKRAKLRWGSLVTDDMRIIWDFSDAKQTKIKLFTIGGDKEPLKVYKEYKKPTSIF